MISSFFFENHSVIWTHFDRTVIKMGMVGYWSFVGEKACLINGFNLLSLSPGRSEDVEFLYFYDEERNYCRILSDNSVCVEKFPVQLEVERKSWSFTGEVWKSVTGGLGRRNVQVLNPELDDLFSKNVIEFFHASLNGVIFQEDGSVAKVDFNGEVVWQLEGAGRLLGQWHEKGLLLFLFAQDLQFKAIDLNTGEVAFGISMSSKNIRLSTKGDMLALVEGNTLYKVIDVDGLYDISIAEYSSSSKVKDVVISDEHIVVATAEAELYVIQSDGLVLVNALDFKPLANEIYQLTDNSDGFFFSISNKKDLAEEGLSKIVRTDIQELLAATTPKLEEEFLSCQHFIPEPDPTKPGVRVRVVPEPDIDIDTLCRHLPIGMYRAAFENATCIGPGYVEGKFELPDFNGTIYVDFGGRELEADDVELLRAYIKAVHERIKWGGYGTPDKKQLARVVTNCPGLFDEQ